MNLDARSAFELKETNRLGLLRNLVSVVETADNVDDWKGTLLVELLSEEETSENRAAIWNAAAAYARGSYGGDVGRLVAIGWAELETSKPDETSIEFETMDNFLEDVRIFGGVDSPLDVARILDAKRFEAFRWIREAAAKSGFSKVVPILMTLKQSQDFVIRESVANAIGVIYSRADACITTLGDQQRVLHEILQECLSDSHWYVRRSAENALFFEEQYLEDPS